MQPAEYLRIANATLAAIDDAVTRLGDARDLDIEATRSGNVLSIETPGGSVIVNLQEPMQELWIASLAGGYHFRWSGQAWCDTRDQGTLDQRLSAAMSRVLAQPVEIALVGLQPPA